MASFLTSLAIHLKLLKYYFWGRLETTVIIELLYIQEYGKSCNKTRLKNTKYVLNPPPMHSFRGSFGKAPCGSV